MAIADGTIRWRQPATPSDTTSGIPLTPDVVDGLVAYLRPDAKATLAARLVVASPDTGSDRLVSEPMVIRSHPGHCADGKDICVMTVEGNRPDVSRRFSVGAGAPVPDAASLPVGSRKIGEDLLDLGQRQPEVLAGFDHGTVRWRSPLTSHFSAGYTTDEGWEFELYKSSGLYVGSVGHPPDRSNSSTVVVDLSVVQTVAIEAGSGSSAWRSDGTSFECHASVSLERIVPGDRSEAWPVRCRYKGVARYDRATSTATYQALDVTVEGFDVATGNTTWSLPLGPAEAFMAAETEAIPVSGSEVLVQGATGPLIVDLGDGSTRKPKKGEAFWCATDAVFEYREARGTRSGGTSNSWRGGTLLAPCAADRSATTARPGSLGPTLGATAGKPHGGVHRKRARRLRPRRSMTPIT